MRDPDAPIIGEWVLKNWGPGDARNVYVTGDPKEILVEHELWDAIPAKESVPLFRRQYMFTFALRQSPPRLRILYDDDTAREIVKFVPLPPECFR